jgi:aminopeptidase-like protein
MVRDQLATARSGELGKELHRFAAELYPICRSITGEGTRDTLRRIGERIPLQLVDVATGSQVFDWTVPREWNIRDAWIRKAGGDRVIEFSQSNLHVLNYSRPLHATMSLEELRPHLFTLPAHPDWIPYRTKTKSISILLWKTDT